MLEMDNHVSVTVPAPRVNHMNVLVVQTYLDDSGKSHCRQLSRTPLCVIARALRLLHSIAETFMRKSDCTEFLPTTVQVTDRILLVHRNDEANRSGSVFVHKPGGSRR